MKRYVLFAFDTYYPRGGWGDMRGTFEVLDDALAASRGLTQEHWHIVDMQTRRIVERSV